MSRRIAAIKADLKTKTTKEGWVLPRQTTSFADPGTW